jgi:ribosomal protein S1
VQAYAPAQIAAVHHTGCGALQFAVAWQRLRQLQEEDATLEATVTSVNRGGLLVEAASLRGFIPTSHVSVVRTRIGARQRHFRTAIARVIPRVDKSHL